MFLLHLDQSLSPPNACLVELNRNFLRIWRPKDFMEGHFKFGAWKWRVIIFLLCEGLGHHKLIIQFFKRKGSSIYAIYVVEWDGAWKYFWICPLWFLRPSPPPPPSKKSLLSNVTVPLHRGEMIGELAVIDLVNIIRGVKNAFRYHCKLISWKGVTASWIRLQNYVNA